MPENMSQELRDWICAERKAGVSMDELRSRMDGFGWHANAIDRMLLSEPLWAGQRKDTAVPMPDLALLPSALDCGDRRVRVQAFMHRPTMVLLGDFLAENECEEVVRLARPRLQRSEIINTREGGSIVSYTRSSRGMFFDPGENSLISRIESRVAHFAGWPVECLDPMQVLHYEVGDTFESHHDFFDVDAPATPAMLEYGGQRLATILMYLNTPDSGGMTSFPDVEFEVMAHRGSAVFFSYPTPHPDTQTLHSGVPVVQGEKWIATIWMRERICRPEKL